VVFMEQVKILLLDLDPGSDLGRMLRRILESPADLGIRLQHESLGTRGLDFYDGGLSKILSSFDPDVIFLVLSPGTFKQAGALLPSLRRELPDIPVMVVMEAREPDEVLELLRLGAADFITPPLKAVDIFPRLWQWVDRVHWRDTPEALMRTLKEKLGLKQLVGKSPAFLAEIKKIPSIAQCQASVLISGETGTGKEVCARAIHYLSPRAGKPFIPVNCGAIPVELVENELFGHARGAFTGASTSQPGLIHEADGGTLFLDEIDSLPPLAQVKLLRFLQEKEYRPLGSVKTHLADVRIISATNVHLEVAAREGRFRQDLYYRLNVIPLTLPPLRERREDIPLLAHHFLAKYAAELNKRAMDFSSDAMQLLMLYEWPGNVRELEHVVQRAVVLSGQGVIQKDHIHLPNLETIARQESFQEAKAKVIEQFEKTYIRELLLAHQGNITKAAQAAKKNRRAFWQLMRKHQIDVQNFKPGAP